MARGTNQPSKNKGMSYTKFGYLFIAPFVVVYCLFSLYPLLTTFWYAGTHMESTNASFWGFSDKEVYYDKYLDLRTYFSDDLEGRTGINGQAYNNIKRFFAVQKTADERNPIDPDGLQNIVNNGELSQAARDAVAQTIANNDISYIASNDSVLSELRSWKNGFVDLGSTILGQLGAVKTAADAAVTVEESEDGSDPITAEDILTSDSYAAFIDTLDNGEFDEGQVLLINYLADYAGVSNLSDFFKAEDVVPDSDMFYFICANLSKPNATYTADGETSSVSSISVPFMSDLEELMKNNVWSSSIPAVNSYSELENYISGETDLHANEEQLYADLSTLYDTGLINSQVKLVQEGDVLVQSTEPSNNVLAALRQYIDTGYQSDPVKLDSSIQIGRLFDYIDNTDRTDILSRAGIDVDQYITFNGDFDVNKYRAFKTELGLESVLTLDKYQEIDQIKKDENVAKAQATLDENQAKLADVQAAYDAAVASGDDAAASKAFEDLRKVEVAISTAESTIKLPSGVLEKADAGTDYLFVGMSNFKEIFQNKNRFNVVLGAFYTTFVMWIIGFIPQILLALLLSAWFTDNKLKLKGLGAMKALMYLPNVITAATIAIFFRRLFSFSTGQAASPVQMFLDAIGHERFNFFASAWATRLIVCFINFWMWYGNTMIVLIAGITSISESLYESAQLDGCNTFQTYTKITMPLLRPMLLYTFVTSMIGGLQMYDIPFNLNQNPALVNFNGTYIKSSQTVLMYVNTLAFGKSSVKQIGIASAVSVILCIVTTILSIIIFYIMRDKDAAAAAKAKKLARKAGGNR